MVVSVFAESFPNRPTAGEMDNIVVKGTECTHGVNERCQATQVSPPFVKTNSAGWYLDQNAMGTMASTIRSLVPYYVDTNTVYDGTTNIAMLTTNGLWATLQIGDKTNKFTCIPGSGTNAATYGDNPGKIYIEDLLERYKVAYELKDTFPASSVASLQYWHGVGYGSNFAEAVASAVTNYAKVPNPPLTTELRQHCKVMFWSNKYCHIIPGETPGSSSNRGQQYVTYYSYNYDLVVAVTGNVITNLIATGANLPTIWYTNDTAYLIVTGDTVPDMNGDYYWSTSLYCWARSGSGRIIGGGDPPGSQYQLWEDGSGAYWTNSVPDVESGTYYPAGAPAAGTATVVLRPSYEYTNSTPALASCSGFYNYSGGSWVCASNGHTVANAGVDYWTISDGTSGVHWELSNSTPFGAYTPIGHSGTLTAAESEEVGASGGAGTYVGPHPGTWSPGDEFSWQNENGWWAVCQGTNCYITPDADTLTPAWKKEDSNPNGVYGVIVGTGLFGEANGEIRVETNT